MTDRKTLWLACAEQWFIEILVCMNHKSCTNCSDLLKSVVVCLCVSCDGLSWRTLSSLIDHCDRLLVKQLGSIDWSIDRLIDGYQQQQETLKEVGHQLTGKPANPKHRPHPRPQSGLVSSRFLPRSTSVLRFKQFVYPVLHRRTTTMRNTVKRITGWLRYASLSSSSAQAASD